MLIRFSLITLFLCGLTSSVLAAPKPTPTKELQFADEESVQVSRDQIEELILADAYNNLEYSDMFQLFFRSLLRWGKSEAITGIPAAMYSKSFTGSASR